MASLVRIVVCFLMIAPGAAGGTSLIMRASARSRTRTGVFAGLRYSLQDPAAQTILTLDTNRDGRIDPGEIAAFAQLQGLDANAATEEFSSIDANGDGVLDSAELKHVLGAPATAAAVPTKQEDPATAPAVPASSIDKATPVAIESPAPAPRVMPSNAAQSFQEPKQSTSELLSQESQQSVSSELISAESRESMRIAAQRVSDELKLEESEEKAARDLDRKAAQLHAKSAALAKQTVQNAQDAAAKAAHAKTDEILSKITKLEDKAEQAEVRAAALHAKSKMETEEATGLMAVANQAIK